MAKYEGSAADKAEDARGAKRMAKMEHASKKAPPKRKAPPPGLGLAMPPGGDPMMGGGEDMGGM